MLSQFIDLVADRISQGDVGNACFIESMLSAIRAAVLGLQGGLKNISVEGVSAVEDYRVAHDSEAEIALELDVDVVVYVLFLFWRHSLEGVSNKKLFDIWFLLLRFRLLVQGIV